MTVRSTATQYAQMTLVFVADVDAADDIAVKLGGPLVDATTDMPWGMRRAIDTDPGGHVWELSTHQRDVALDRWGAEQTESWIKRPSSMSADS